MRMFWTLQVGIGVAAIAGFTALGVACSSTSTSTSTDTGVGGGTTDTSSTDTATDTNTDTETNTDTGTDCMVCICTDTSGGTPAGCADTCDNTKSGATTPNYCNGSPALSQCKACVTMRCAGCTLP